MSGSANGSCRVSTEDMYTRQTSRVFVRFLNQLTFQPIINNLLFLQPCSIIGHFLNNRPTLVGTKPVEDLKPNLLENLLTSMALAGKRDPNFRLVGKVYLTAKASFEGCSHVHKSLPSSCRICWSPILTE
jgi:hypothetical protein